MAYAQLFKLIFSDTDTGLTLRGQLKDTAGVDSGAAFTDDANNTFAEIGRGIYQLHKTDIPDGFRGSLVILNDATGDVLGSGGINPETAEYTDVAVSSRAPASEYDTELDAAISTRSSHTAAEVATAVWSATSRTLTSFGTLVADTAAAVWNTLLSSLEE